MKLSKITYGKSFMLRDDLWEKIGCEIEMDDTDDREKARQLATEFVEYTFKKNNPDLPIESIQFKTPFPIINREETGNSEIDEEYNQVKRTLESLSTYDLANNYLNSTDFKHTIELKKIVSNKPKAPTNE